MIQGVDRQRVGDGIIGAEPEVLEWETPGQVSWVRLSAVRKFDPLACRESAGVQPAYGLW